MPSSFARPELLVDSPWLARSHRRGDVRVLDCRWRVDGSGRRLHAEGHVPGSIHVDWARELATPAEGVPFRLAGPEAIADVMARAGADHKTTLVLLDDTHSLYAARAWWSLRAYGHDGVRLLDGGWPAWLEQGGPVSAAATTIEPVEFTPLPEPRGRVSADDVRAMLGSALVQIVDARTPAEYLGQGGSGPRRGHIHGALNLPAALLVQDGSQLLPTAADLTRLLSRHGLHDNKRVVTYDASGVGAAKLAFCLELMGFDDVALFDGGWPDWAARDEEEFPIEAG